MKNILFICVENSCRSQMAEGFARHFGKGIIEVYSAGSKPSGNINQIAIQIMQESKIDISKQKSKGFNDLNIKKFDYAITLGCQDACPFVPADKHIEWEIADPKGKDIIFFRKVRDNIENKVIELIGLLSLENKKEVRIMERHLDQELEDLKKQLLNMGALTETAIFESVEALKELSAGKAKKVISDDNAIDELENTIDETCLDLLALQQPVALDLRFITMSMKISTDLERIADLAVDIAQRVLELSGKPILKPLIDIPKLADLAKQMTKDALNAFVNKDADLAGKVILLDNEADKLRNMVQKELVEDYISKDRSTVSRALPLLLIARHLERICDHATNIAEDIIYLVKADVVKHHPEKLK
jgi:phosphate transport system protein